MDVALIVAGGTGIRMESDIPKQFMDLSGRPILMHTLDAFHHASSNIALVLVLPQDYISQWHQICLDLDYQTPHEVVAGGDTRFQSVKKGLEKVEDGHMVAIHDGVRPLIRQALIVEAFEQAKEVGSAIVSVPLKESIRKLLPSGRSESIDRSNFISIQTPQVFRAIDIKRAYRIPEREEFTDDASVAEWDGIEINLINGDYSNIKITTREDLVFAEAYLNSTTA